MENPVAWHLCQGSLPPNRLALRGAEARVEEEERWKKGPAELVSLGHLCIC